MQADQNEESNRKLAKQAKPMESFKGEVRSDGRVRHVDATIDCSCPLCIGNRMIDARDRAVATPITRAKWEIPTADEVHEAFIEFCKEFHWDAQIAWTREAQIAMTHAISKFIERRNAKL